MQFEDFRIGKLYRNMTNNFVFKVKGIKNKGGKIYLEWSAMNRKGLEGRIFCDDIAKIKLNDIFEEKNTEIYEY